MNANWFKRNNAVAPVGRAVSSPPFANCTPRRGGTPRPTKIPRRTRCFAAQHRLRASLRNGALIGALLLPFSPATFAASNEVARGLAWLASQQHVDGSWSTNAVLNALPVLAFLSDGNLPATAGYGTVIDHGVRYLLTQQTADGAFTNGGARMYGHGVTTLVLAEILGMVQRETGVRPRLTKAVELILKAQAVPKGDLHAGGWRHFPRSTDSDLAVTVWQVAALRAALNAGLHIPREAFERAAHYLQRCEHPRGGFAYQPGGFPSAGRTAAATVALRMCGKFDLQPSPWFPAQPVTWDDEYFYHGTFFCAQAGQKFDAALLTKIQNTDGSWPLPPHSLDEAEAGPLFTTSLAILALTAKDHYLPVFSVTD